MRHAVGDGRWNVPKTLSTGVKIYTGRGKVGCATPLNETCPSTQGSGGSNGCTVAAAEVSAPGSVLLAMSVTEALVKGAKSSDHVLVQQFVFGCAPDPKMVRTPSKLYNSLSFTSTSEGLITLRLGRHRPDVVCNSKYLPFLDSPRKKAVLIHAA